MDDAIRHFSEVYGVSPERVRKLADVCRYRKVDSPLILRLLDEVGYQFPRLVGYEVFIFEERMVDIEDDCVPTIVGEPVSVGTFALVEEAAACAASYERDFDEDTGLGVGAVIQHVFE